MPNALRNVVGGTLEVRVSVRMCVCVCESVMFWGTR